jgi:hypothetical protein
MLGGDHLPEGSKRAPAYTFKMNIEQIIAELDAEIGRLKQVKALLGGATAATTAKTGPGRPKSISTPAKKKKRNLTPEGRARIAAAVKARWAKAKNA